MPCGRYSSIRERRRAFKLLSLLRNGAKIKRFNSHQTQKGQWRKSRGGSRTAPTENGPHPPNPPLPTVGEGGENRAFQLLLLIGRCVSPPFPLLEEGGRGGEGRITPPLLLLGEGGWGVRAVFGRGGSRTAPTFAPLPKGSKK